MKIAICGGHLTPALAVMEELKEHNPSVSYLFFGRKFTQDNNKNLSLEFKTLKNWDNITFINQYSCRWQRFFTLKNLLTPIKVKLGFLQSLYCLFKLKPDVVVSFGGYLSVPVVTAAWMLNIPILSHEQTTSAGMASKINSFFSSIICVSWPESLDYFDKNKTILTGNPLRKSIITPNMQSPFLQLTKERLPIIFITGGNQGSHVINESIKEILPELLKKYVVIHQCGNLTEYDDYQKLLTIKNSLPGDLQKHYHLYAHIDPQDLGAIYKICNLVVGRSGVNTITELLHYKKKSILIPLPFAQNNEQQKNARMLSDAGLTLIINQADLSSGILLGSVEEILNNKALTGHVSDILKINSHAAFAIAQQIIHLYEKKKNRH